MRSVLAERRNRLRDYRVRAESFIAQGSPRFVLTASIVVALILGLAYRGFAFDTIPRVVAEFVLPVLVLVTVQWLTWVRASGLVRAFYRSLGSKAESRSEILSFVRAQVDDLSRGLAELISPEGHSADGSEISAWMRRMHHTSTSRFTELRWVEDLADVSDALEAQATAIRRDGLKGGTRILVAPLPDLREIFRQSEETLHNIMMVHRADAVSLAWLPPELTDAVANRHRVSGFGTSVCLWDGQYALSASKASRERQQLRLVFDGPDLARLSAYLNDLRELAVPIEDELWFADGRPPDPLDTLIRSLLDRDASVSPADLPLTRDAAASALGRFVDTHRELALTIAPQGLQWARSKAVRASQELLTKFERETAIAAVGDLLAAIEIDSVAEGPGPSGSVLTLVSDPILPARLLVTTSGQEFTSRLAAEVADIATRHTPTSRLAIHVSPSALDTTLQKNAAVNIVALQPGELLGLARGADLPRDGIVKSVLRQADLAKVSPFVLRSATPEEMYYGREQEQAQVLTNLHANSVAVLGGRMIGKTSFLYRMNGALTKAGFAAYLADCQTAANWEQFAALAERVWGVQLGPTFRPEAIFDLIEQLAVRSVGKPLVLILDEIDKLLEWDRIAAADDSVPDELFRAFRSASQEQRAQFIFSGERTIARRLADPNSPHWNFCEPLLLRQLTTGAASELLIRPLKSLQVGINSEPEFAHAAWEVTSGHPQITQFLGDRLVRALAERKAENRTSLSPADLKPVAESFEFRRHYLETYWGQAEPLERLLSVRIGEGVALPSDLQARIASHIPGVSSESLDDALRVLELLGVIEQGQLGYRLRASWLPNALSVQGDVAAFAEQLASAVR